MATTHNNQTGVKRECEGEDEIIENEYEDGKRTAMGTHTPHE